MTAQRSPNPNIVYILADDLGYGDIGSYNPHSKIPTDHIDRLASEGIRCTDAHAPSSVCTPSRYAILTGRYCWRSRLTSGVLWEWDASLIEPGRLTVAGLLREGGYRTACFGKWHLGWNWRNKGGGPLPAWAEYGKNDERNRKLRAELATIVDFEGPIGGGPIDHGFDYYFGDDVPNFPPYSWFINDRLTGSPTAEMAESVHGHGGPMVPGWKFEDVLPTLARRAADYIEQLDHRQPFFVYLALTSPHSPVVPTSEFVGRSSAGTYGDYVVETDWAVGEILSALERRDIVEDTLVIFTSDNGPEYTAYPRILEYDHYSMGELRGVKRDLWEGGHRVPFLARWPGHIPSGLDCPASICLVDLMATVAAVTGSVLPLNAAEDSLNILPVLLGEASDLESRVIVHHSFSGSLAIRRGPWVLIDHPGGDDLGNEPTWFRAKRGYQDEQSERCLYDLRRDLAERRNLYAERPELAAEMIHLLESIKRSGRSVLPDDGS